MKDDDLMQGLSNLLGYAMGVLNVVALIATWGDPSMLGFRCVSLGCWLLFFLLAFFVAGAERERQQNDKLKDYWKGKQYGDGKNNQNETNCEKENDEEN